MDSCVLGHRNHGVFEELDQSVVRRNGLDDRTLQGFNVGVVGAFVHTEILTVGEQDDDEVRVGEGRNERSREAGMGERLGRRMVGELPPEGLSMDFLGQELIYGGPLNKTLPVVLPAIDQHLKESRELARGRKQACVASHTLKRVMCISVIYLAGESVLSPIVPAVGVSLDGVAEIRVVDHAALERIPV